MTTVNGDREVDRPKGNQLDFINKLREVSQEKEETFQKFLKDKGKADVSGLTVNEASSLIVALKTVKVQSENSGKHTYATWKQRTFLTKL
jgi:hypothetical protein